MNRADLRAALAHPNVLAFYMVVRSGESSLDDDAYRMRYNGPGNRPAFFESFADHPRVFVDTGEGTRSSAAGAPQATATTFDEERAKYGWPDFTPQTQDEFFVARLVYRKALEAVKAGRFAEACQLCRKEWTSLPGGAEENAATRHARETFLRWGGTLAGESGTKPAAGETKAPESGTRPTFQDILDEVDRVTDHDAWQRAERYGDRVTESTTRPIPSADEQEAHMEPLTISFLAGLAGKLIEGFAPLAQEKVSKEIARHTDNPQVAGQVAGVLIDAAKMVTGKADEVAAVAAARADPVVMAKVQEAALDGLAKLAPVLDKVAELDERAWAAEEASRDAAAKRAAADPNDRDPYLTTAIVWLMGCVTASLGVAVVVLAYLGKPFGEVLALFGMLVGVIAGKFGTRYDHRYGSSRSSGAKDIVIDELARRRK